MKQHKDEPGSALEGIVNSPQQKKTLYSKLNDFGKKNLISFGISAGLFTFTQLVDTDYISPFYCIAGGAAFAAGYCGYSVIYDRFVFKKKVRDSFKEAVGYSPGVFLGSSFGLLFGQYIASSL